MEFKKLRKNRIVGFVLNTHSVTNISLNGDTGKYSYPLREAPRNTPEETERVERIVERVVEEHGETIKKLADE
jgi:hypothetical protein